MSACLLCGARNLHRRYAYFFTGEAPPVALPATSFGGDVQFGHGPWNINGEWQRFYMPYRAISDFTQHAGYLEIRRVLHPR